jgi:hypothetical protein
MKLRCGNTVMMTGLSILLVLAGASALFAQAEPEVRKGFFISAQTSIVSGIAFPTGYSTYRSIGGADVPDALGSGETGPVASRPGFALAVGYEWRIKALRMGAEVEGTFVSASDGTEHLRDVVYYGATYTQDDTERLFTQSGRKLSLVDLSFFMGLFPFRSFGLGFNVTAGGGYGRLSFTSPAVADAASRGFNPDLLNGQTDFDFGTYGGGGSWARGSFIYFVGLGAEYEISGRLSLRLDYKYVASSYTRENVLISSGAVNVYQDTKGYEYTVGNKFSLGLNFRI